MARPLRDGVDYFSFDVGTLRDRKIKLIKGEFGAIGVLAFLHILSSIYEENGYFKRWSEDDCILVCDEVGCGCTPGTIAEVVKGCIRRSLFDEGVFTAFGVLTSAGIQRRFIRAASQRDDIFIIKEYWLLNIDDKKDVPASVLNKIGFKSVTTSGNPVKTCFNPDKTPGNPKSKGKQRKGKEIYPPKSPHGGICETDGQSLSVKKAEDQPDNGGFSMTPEPRRQKRSILTAKQKARFDQFWQAYPNKKDIGKAERAFAKIDPDDEQINEILSGLERAKKNDSRFLEKRYTPMPSTWLNAKGWLSEYIEEGGQAHGNHVSDSGESTGTHPQEMPKYGTLL